MSGDRTATSPRRAAPTPGVYRLLVLYGAGATRAGHSKVLERSLLLSRDATDADPDADAGAAERLWLDDPEVSRSHALLSRSGADDGWHLRDEGSHNGTYVNARRVEQAALCAGDVIRVGQHVLLLQQLDLPQSQRLARRRAAGTPIVGDSPACKQLETSTPSAWCSTSASRAGGRSRAKASPRSW
jgi:hypothetical protein